MMLWLPMRSSCRLLITSLTAAVLRARVSAEPLCGGRIEIDERSEGVSSGTGGFSGSPTGPTYRHAFVQSVGIGGFGGCRWGFSGVSVGLSGVSVGLSGVSVGSVGNRWVRRWDPPHRRPSMLATAKADRLPAPFNRKPRVNGPRVRNAGVR